MVNIPVREAFSNRGAAEAARDRLEYGGFTRNRVQLMRLGDEFVLITFASSEDEKQHARDLMNNTGWVPDWASRYGRQIAQHAPSPGQTLLGLSLLAGAGAALYWAVTRGGQDLDNRRREVRSFHTDPRQDNGRHSEGRDRQRADLHSLTADGVTGEDHS